PDSAFLGSAAEKAESRRTASGRIRGPLTVPGVVATVIVLIGSRRNDPVLRRLTRRWFARSLERDGRTAVVFAPRKNAHDRHSSTTRMYKRSKSSAPARARCFR